MGVHKYMHKNWNEYDNQIWEMVQEKGKTLTWFVSLWTLQSDWLSLLHISISFWCISAGIV